ncbi:MAG TPA: DUF2500 domain-containing protein [Firmicutes bacterium]|mgnify:CR=1 FL=1|nr:DUF2500 domain-containing protein [Bacillota bacterium]
MFSDSGFGPPPFFNLVFGLILVVFAYIIISNIVEWSRNQASDVHMRNVRVVAKRTSVHGDHAHTTYYATFEFLDDGARLELRVPAKQFGLMAEGDLGILNYQGTQFNAFELTRNEGIHR